MALDSKPPGSEESGWGSKSLTPPADAAPLSSPTVSEEEIVSEDEILESELSEDRGNESTLAKTAAAGGTEKG